MDYKTTGKSIYQPNITFTPFRNDRIIVPVDPAFPGPEDRRVVRDTFISLGTYFTGKDSSVERFSSVMTFGGPVENELAYVRVGLYSTPYVYYQGANIGQQFGWVLPPPAYRGFDVPLAFDNSRTVSTIGCNCI